MNALNEARQALGGDPKKGALLLVLVAVLGFVVLRGRGGAGGLPAKASASAAASAGWTVGAGGAVQAPTLGKLSALVGRWRETPVPAAGRDLFASPVRHVPNVVIRPTAAAQAPTDEDGRFWRQVDAQMRTRDERERHRQMTRSAVLRAAGQLPIASIVHGPDCRAIVGGKLVRPGQSVEAPDGKVFTVVGIEQWRVLAEHAGVRVALPVGAAEPYLLDE